MHSGGLGDLGSSSIKDALLLAVAMEDIDHIPPEFNDLARFVICAVNVVARRAEGNGFSLFVYSEAPIPEGKPLGFTRVAHMQDGHGDVFGRVVLTSRDANNGSSIAVGGTSVDACMNRLESLGLDDRLTVIWDGHARSATVYPNGIANLDDYSRFLVPKSDAKDLTQDEVCEVLDIAYNDNLKTPTGRTAKLWHKGTLVSTAEDEIERHLKGQIAMFFAGRQRPIRVLSQTNTAAGRTDLILMQRSSGSGPKLCGVVELKVLRGPEAKDYEATTEAISQGHYYRKELELPFATVALYDVFDPPKDDAAPLLLGQDAEQLAHVRVRRFAIFSSPKSWRDAKLDSAA